MKPQAITRLLGSRWGLLAALLAGLAIPFAFAPFSWVAVAILSPAILFLVLASAPRRRALWAVFIYGMAYYGAGASWVFISVDRYGAGWLVGVVFCALLAAVSALYFLLMGWLWRRLRGRSDFVDVALGLPAVWVAVEWFRSWFLTGNTWLTLGYTQTDSALAGYTPVFGVLGVSLAVAVCAGALAWVVLQPSRRNALIAAALVAAVWLGGYGLGQLTWTRPAGKPLKVALVQGDVPQDRKWATDFRDETLQRYWDLTAEHWDADLVVWPETAVPAWLHQVADGYLTRLYQAARAHHTDLLVGIPVYDQDDQKAYNAVMSIGSKTDFYFKQHLVPFGEYLPLRSLLGQALDVFGAPMSDFAAGTSSRPLMAAGYPVGVSICYEIIFGTEIARELPQSQLLVNVSNDGWFGDSLGPHQHLQMARMRAIEMERPVLRATNTGLTAIIDWRGRIKKEAPQFKVAAIAGTVTPRKGATPFVRWLNYPVLGMVGLIGIAMVFVRRRRKDVI